MSATLQRRARGTVTSASLKTQKLNAETVTAIATSFLKRIGHKTGIKPKRVTSEEGAYIVEVELRKLMAIVRVDVETCEIREYEIQPKGEEASFVSISPKTIAVIFCVSAVAYIALYSIFQMLGF